MSLSWREEKDFLFLIYSLKLPKAELIIYFCLESLEYCAVFLQFDTLSWPLISTSNMRLFLLRVSILCSFICYKALLVHRSHKIMTFLKTNAHKLIYKLDAKSEVTEYSKKYIIELHSLDITFLVQIYFKALPKIFFLDSSVGFWTIWVIIRNGSKPILPCLLFFNGINYLWFIYSEC